MGYVFIWWLWVEVLGLIAFPLAFAVFKGLPDRGYAFAKALAILLLGYFLWLTASLHILPNARGSIILLIIVLVIASLFIFRRHRSQLMEFLRENRSLILTIEVVFALSFAIWALVRAYDPDIAATEKPMDFAFLNGILRSQHFPPNDPWLSGLHISYYYFGYLMIAMLSKLTGVPSAVSFNLALALLFALTVIGAFSLVYNLVRLSGKSESESTHVKAIGFGLVGAMFLVVLGNWEGVLELVRAHGLGSDGFWQWISIKDLSQPYQSESWYPTDTWWWWRATRIIDTVVDTQSLDYTITEFPFFSFLLGDLHPHVMALPFVLLALSLSLNLLASSERLSLTWLRTNPLQFGCLALCLGGLGFLNSWDFPTFTMAFVAAGSIHAYIHREEKRGWLKDVSVAAGFVVAGSVLLYLPFYVGFRSQASGILPLREVSTRPLHYVIFWGLFLFASLSFLLAQFGRSLRGRPILRPWMLWTILPTIVPVLLWGIVRIATDGPADGSSSLLRKLWQLLPLMVILYASLFSILRQMAIVGEPGQEPVERRSDTFVLLLILTGFFLTLGCELFYVADVFGSRMNTVFKLYYQAWVLLAIASAYGLYCFAEHLRSTGRLGRLAKHAWWVMLFVFVTFSAVYPIAATLSKTGAFAGEPTLDGLAHVKRMNPDEDQAIEWLNENVQGAPVIVEATGDEYSDYGRVSAWTGLPTLLGWAGHEIQWRGSDRDFRGRAEDIDQIYLSEDWTQVGHLLEKYDVTYIYVGQLEKARYGQRAGQEFSESTDIAFQNEGVTIYQVRPD